MKKKVLPHRKNNLPSKKGKKKREINLNRYQPSAGQVIEEKGGEGGPISKSPGKEETKGSSASSKMKEKERKERERKLI